MHDENAPANDRTHEEWVVLRETLDPVEAELIAGLLQSGGIDARIESRVFRQEPLPAIRAMSRILIWVPAEEQARAAEVLASAPSLAEDEDPLGGGDGPATA